MSTASPDQTDWTIYTPIGREEIGNPVVGLLRGVRKSRGLAWRLLVRDLSAQYRQSLLGYVWAFVPPLALVLSFTLAGQANIVNTTSSSFPYPLMALIGVVLWQTFADAFLGPIVAIKSAHRTLSRIAVPCEALVMAKLAESAVTLAIRMTLVAAAMWWYGFMPSPTACGVIAPVVMLLLFGTALGLFLAPLGGLYDDVKNSVTLLLGLWFMLTPVMYEQAAAGSVIARINAINPVTSLVVTGREFLTGAPLTHTTSFGVVTALAIVMLIFAWPFYRASLSYIAERSSG